MTIYNKLFLKIFYSGCQLQSVNFYLIKDLIEISKYHYTNIFCPKYINTQAMLDGIKTRNFNIFMLLKYNHLIFSGSCCPVWIDYGL